MNWKYFLQELTKQMFSQCCRCNGRSIEDKDTLVTKYNAVINLKISEGEIQWDRYNAMLVVNTIIIGFLGLNDIDFPVPQYLDNLFLLIPLLGIFLCFVWYQMTNRGFIWTKFWMDKAFEIEKELSGKINPIIEGRKLRDSLGIGLTKNFSLTIIIFFGIIYFIIFIINIVARF